MKKTIKKVEGESLPTPQHPELRQGEMIVYTEEFFRKQGSIGGKIGGRILSDSLSPKERKEKAQKAIKARWDKYKKQKEEEKK